MTATDSAAQAAAIGAGAPSPPEQMWLQADWPRIKEEVKRLQERIAKATMESKWGKVKVLQRLLTRSHSGKMLAVKRVTENRGKRTPGVDGKLWSTPAAKWKGMASMQHRSYRALPLRPYLHPKEQWQEAPVRDSSHALQVNASIVETRSGTRFRDLGGPELLWISAQALDRRCDRILFHHAGKTLRADVGS